MVQMQFIIYCQNNDTNKSQIKGEEVFVDWTSQESFGGKVGNQMKS